MCYNLSDRDKRKGAMRKVILALLALTVGTALTAQGAEFRRERGHISITGRIEPGDLAKFRSFLAGSDEVLIDLLQGGVALDSVGGDVRAALGIARILRMSHASVLIKKGAVCYSSCFLVFAGGSYRIASSGSLGVHRLSFAMPASIAETEKMLEEVGGSIESYLRSSGIPERIIEKMRDTPPSELFRITTPWLVENDLHLDYRPAFIDVVSKQCGSEPLMAGARDDGRQEAWLGCMEKVRWQEQKRNMRVILKLIARER